MAIFNVTAANDRSNYAGNIDAFSLFDAAQKASNLPQFSDVRKFQVTDVAARKDTVIDLDA